MYYFTNALKYNMTIFILRIEMVIWRVLQFKKGIRLTESMLTFSRLSVSV